MKHTRIKLDNATITVFIEEGELKKCIYEKDGELPIGTIVHARVKKADKKTKTVFVDIGESVDAFFSEEIALKAGDDDLFCIRKTPDDEKGYTIDGNFTLEDENGVLNIKKNYLNNIEDICFTRKAGGDENILIKTWESIKNEKNTLPIPKVVYRAKSRAEREIDNLNSEELEDFDLNYIAKENAWIFERKIDLNGGYLYVDVLPYITFFDINSGNFNSYYSSDRNRHALNAEAMKKIVHIIEARNIEGVILVDLLKTKKNIQFNFLNELKQKYPFINFHDITKLGILEMTVKKTGGKTITKEMIFSNL